MNFAVMYHYVREQNGWSGISPLTPDAFERQIDAILDSHQIVSVEKLRNRSLEPKAVITFDDGTKDQYRFAFEILQRKGVQAYFAVMSGPRITGEIPLVHLIHTVLSFISDEQLWGIISDAYSIDDLTNKSAIYHYEANLFRRYNKYVLNFLLNEQEARRILEPIFKDIFPDNPAFIDEYYLSDSEIIEMHNAGMTIGVHCHKHTPYYGNALHYFENEILPCKEYLERLGITPRWYTPPFGGGNLHKEMQKELTPILMEAGFTGGFLTTPGVIDDTYNFWISRLDCNKLVNLDVQSVLKSYL
ncbi:polysaccharide deacetylase family protein [Paenibacillus sp. EC2-1]|uniref:polysaccharide deacetylase family protein n=1 Tax=Paenibacillus sp. EC2-1 TaxID=3388665 RepID=UPI003BEEFEEC